VVIIKDVVTDNRIIIIMGKTDQAATERTPLVKRVVQLEIETSQSTVGKAVLVVMIATSNAEELIGAHTDVGSLEEQDAETRTKGNHHNNSPQKRHNKINLIILKDDKKYFFLIFSKTKLSCCRFIY
jgi:hypothetical protein